MKAKASFLHLPPFDEHGDLHVIVDTPKGNRNKFKFEEKLNLFSLGGVLPSGAVFPFDFGFIPSTRGEDGDALDVLILMEEPAFVGCLVRCRLLGVIEAEQTEKGQTFRNDRLIAVAAKSHVHKDVGKLGDVSDQLLEEIEHFFESYNKARGKLFKPLRRSGPDAARKLVEQATEK